MGYEMKRLKVKKLERFDIKREIILTDEFIIKWWEISNLSEAKILEELKEWFTKNVEVCDKCNKRRVRKYMYENEEEFILCKECKEKEESNNESNDESIDIEIDGRRIMIHKFEIERVKRLGFNKYYLGNLTFIQEYKENEGKSDKELIEILKEWKKPTRYNNSENDEEIFIEKEIIKNIFEELEKLNIETNENEIIRLRNMGFPAIAILRKGFFKKFQGIKDELDSVVKEELLVEVEVQKLLEERLQKLPKVTEYEIRKLVKWEYSEEEIFEEDIIKEYRRLDTELNIYDDNEEEVKKRLENYIKTWKLTREKDEEIESNTSENEEIESNISENQEIEIVTDDKNKDENKLEKPINTDDFVLFENSDPENLNIKPEEINYSESNSSEEIDNMAAQQNQIREDMRQAFITLFGHDIGNNWNALVLPA
jgi:hypothetical protein